MKMVSPVAPRRSWGLLTCLALWVILPILLGGCTFNVLPNVRLADLTNRPPTAGTPLPTDPQPNAPPSGIDWPTIIGGVVALGVTAWIQYQRTTAKVKTIVDTRQPSGTTIGTST